MKEMLQLAQWWRMAACTRTGDVRVKATGVVATATNMNVSVHSSCRAPVDRRSVGSREAAKSSQRVKGPAGSKERNG